MNAVEKIDKQIELEEAASTIYTKLENNAEDEEARELWRTLSVHEKYHAAALKSLKATLSPDELEVEASTLNVENIESLLADYGDFVKEIERGISLFRSFEIAIFMEFSELNSLFFSSLEDEEKASSSYIQSMGKGTKGHLLTLYRGLEKHIGKDGEMPYIDKFRELGLV